MDPTPTGSGSVPTPTTTASPRRSAGFGANRDMVVSNNQDGWLMAVELVAATFTWGGIGYALDRWVFHTAPVLMSIGFMLGFFAGMYLLWLKTSAEVEQPAPTAGGDHADG